MSQVAMPSRLQDIAVGEIPWGDRVLCPTSQGMSGYMVSPSATKKEGRK